MQNKIRIILLALSLFIFLRCHAEIEREPGILADAIPVQNPLKKNEWMKNDYRIIPLASFKIKALVILMHEYSDQGSDLSPIDLALGWKRMSDKNVLERIEFEQYQRFYFWKTRNLPIPKKEIEESSSNMHIIPANEEIEDSVFALSIGSIVEMEGYLVEIRGPDRFFWKSSLKRDDTGAGACELFWVEKISSY